MAEYITFQSIGESTAVLEIETAVGSNIYDQVQFTPAVVEFKVDLDTLDTRGYPTIISRGTPIPQYPSTGRKVFLYSQDRQYRIRFNAASNTVAKSEKYVSGVWTQIEYSMDCFGTHPLDGFGIALLPPNPDIMYIAYNTGATAPWHQTRVEFSADVEVLSAIIYGVPFEGEISLVRRSPESDVFTRNQSSQIVYELVAEGGEILSAEITYRCVPSTGWGWDDSTHTLHYISGNYSTRVNVEATYLGQTFETNVTFNSTISAGSPYLPGGNSGFGGGEGNFGQDDRNDNVAGDIPGGSNFGYIGGSIFTHYALSGSQAKNFGEWLWTDDLGLSLWKTVMEKLFNETADALVSLMCFPFNISTLPGVSLGDGNIIAGNLNTGIPARVLDSTYVSINWGSVPLYEYWGNFLDYAPHTKLELYLPWSTGFVPLDPHQCVPGSVSVTTNIDLQKGTCTHNVFAGNTVLGVYEGQCGYEIPLLASNFSAKLAGATVTAVAGLSMGVAGAVSTNAYLGRTIQAHEALEKARPMLLASSGGDLDLYQQAYAGLRQTVMPSPYKEGDTYRAITTGTPAKLASASSAAIAKQSVNVSRNGSFSGSSAGMSVPYPFIVISRPEQNVPTGYGHHFGYPSNITSILGQLKRYTEVGAIHLNGLKALPDEIAELDDILKGGFII